MATIKEYFETAKKGVAEAKESQRENLKECAKLMGDCMLEDGVVQLFGINHGLAFSMELGYRAGGLMPFHQMRTIDLVLRGVVKESDLANPSFNHDEANAQLLWDLYRIDPTDMFILISQTGSEALIVETAKMAKEKGHKVVVVVSEKTQSETKSTHSTGKQLKDYADLVIDNCTPNPDVVVSLNDKTMLAQNSTITGNIFAQMITAETYKYLKDKGEECPVLLSVNVAGADAHNRILSDQYLGRWNS
ncbi:MAG: sugar isomerase domain-containing protein [Erysipelotrichaceae bacterium]